MKKTRVLLVEDDAIQAGLLEKVFAARAAAVETVGSARKALQVAPTFKPDLVITDMLMPGLNGLQLARELRALAPDTLIVGYSAAFVPTDKERSQLQSAFDGWYERTPTSDPKELADYAQGLIDDRRGQPRG